MFEVLFNGMPLRPTAAVFREMEELALGLDDVKFVLENGFDCSPSRRGKGVLERCFKRGDKAVRVVVARDFFAGLEQAGWAVVHVSRSAWSKKLGGKR